METGLEYGLIGAKLGHSFSPEIGLLVSFTFKM